MALEGRQTCRLRVLVKIAVRLGITWMRLSSMSMNEGIACNAVMFVGGILLGACLTLSWCKRETIRFGRKKNENEIKTETAANQSRSKETVSTAKKLVLVVRSDLKMGKGKVAAQCSHAAVLAHEISRKKDPKTLSDWKDAGQPKIVLKVDSEWEMTDLAFKAKNCMLPVSIVQDAGKTQVPSGSKTVLAIGPGLSHEIDRLTGHLKLY